MLRSSLRARILLGMASVAVVATVGMGIGVGVFVDEFAERTVVDRLRDSHRSFQRHLKSRYRLLENFVGQVAETPLLKATLQIEDIDPETAIAQAKQVLAVAQVDFVALIDESGTILADTLADAGDAPLEAQAESVSVALGGATYSGVRDDSSSLYLIASGPVTVGPQLLGAIVVGERIDSGVATEFGEAIGADILFLRGGDPLHWSVPEGNGDRPSFDPHAMAASVAESEGDPADVRRARLPNGDRFLATQTLGPRSSFVVSRSGADLESLRAYLLEMVALLGVVAAAAAMAFSQLVARRLSNPIRDLVLASEQIADGKLHVDVSETGTDEMARLGQAFNHMARRVRQLLDDAAGKAEVLQQQKDQLEWASQVKSNFMVTASHELRTPLTNIASSTEILLRHGGREEPETNAEFLSMIELETGRLMRLIDQLMDLTGFEAGEGNWSEEEFDVDAMTRETVAKFRARHPGREVLLSESGSEVRIAGDPQRFAQLIDQLLDNADKFSPPSEEIRVGVTQPQDGVELRISDRGPGVPDASDKERIFERFVQGGDLLTGKPAGAGLGLPICQEIASWLRARLTCEDNPGGGAVFVLRIDRTAP